jgi:hypothetical protein
MFMVHETLPNEKIIQSPPTKSPPLSYGSSFFLKRRYDYALIVKQV